MSVLIKGMEMPKAGNWKTICIYYDGTCEEPNWQRDCTYMQGCEAVTVPPHGKLIDADVLGKTRKELEKTAMLNTVNCMMQKKNVNTGKIRSMNIAQSSLRVM